MYQKPIPVAVANAYKEYLPEVMDPIIDVVELIGMMTGEYIPICVMHIDTNQN